jgi:hypothetical protein
LSELIAQCPSRIAPARAGELKAFAQQRNLSILYSDDDGFRIRVRLDNNTIVLPVRSLNYLWCATHLFVTLYNRYCEAHQQKRVDLDTASDPATSEALDLFNWARSALRGSADLWPEGHVQPSLNFDAGSEANVVVELFLCALAWIIHHERAHVEHEHKGNRSSNTLQEELQADRSATEWVMTECANDLERQKRAMGIAVATLAMAMLDDPHSPIPEVTTHPPDLERLYDNVDLAELPPNNIVYDFCVVVLMLCVGQYGPVTILEREIITSREVYDDLVVQFHRRHR